MGIEEAFLPACSWTESLRHGEDQNKTSCQIELPEADAWKRDKRQKVWRISSSGVYIH